MKMDVYQKITDRIVSKLEQGVRPWMKPWSAGNGEARIMRPLRATGIPFQGINVLMLWSEAIEKGYASPIWMTFKQALDLKANVRKPPFRRGVSGIHIDGRSWADHAQRQARRATLKAAGRRRAY